MEGVKEIVGPEDALSLIQQARPGDREEGQSFPGLGALERALEERYGECCGQGVAVRVGRASFKYGLQQWGELAGVNHPSYQLLPAGRRIRDGLEKLAQVFSRQTGMKAWIAEDEEQWSFHMEGSIELPEGIRDEPACHMVTGMLEGFMTWAGGGGFYQVTQVECCDHRPGLCLFTINKKPDE